MKNLFRLATMSVFATFAAFGLFGFLDAHPRVAAQDKTAAVSPTPFSQKDTLAKLTGQIAGKESEPAEKVFKNIQMFKGVPAGRLLRIMEMGYARSLGVDCTHCHVDGKWEAEDKPTKQIAREMAAMVNSINSQTLKAIKNLNPNATVNCTTCHRGQTKPALNLPTPAA